MAYTLLIQTIGNRDWQFHKDAPLPPDWVTAFLEKNAEDNTHYVLKKRGGGEYGSFYELSRFLAEAYFSGKQKEILQAGSYFPLLDAAVSHVLNECGHIDKISLLVTQQSRPFAFDTEHIGKVAQHYLQKKYGSTGGVIAVEPCYLNPYQYPPDRAGQFEHSREKEIIALASCEAALQRIEISRYDRVFIGHKAGLPDVTWALKLLGLYQGYTYLDFDAEQGAIPVNYKMLESFLRKRLI